MSYKTLAMAILKRAVDDGATAALQNVWCELLADFADVDITRLQREAAKRTERVPTRSDFATIPATCLGSSFNETMRNIGALPALYTADEIAEFMGITRQRVVIIAAHQKVRFKRLTHLERGARTRNQWSGSGK